MKNLKQYLPSRRKLMQLYFALLYNANLKGFATGNIYQGAAKQLCVPGLNCYSCPGAVGACPLGALQGAFSADKSTLFYVGGILLLYGVLFGRMICGWMCPFGLLQELAYKLRTPKLKKGPVTRCLSFVKYGILILFVFLIPMAYALRDVPLPGFCKFICPAGTLEGGIALLSHRVNSGYFSMLGPLFTWKFLLLVSISVGCVFLFRLFCRFLCPLGALYGLFNRFSCFGVAVEESKCVHCGLCQTHCKVDIRHVGDAECISCGACINVCPTDAIGWKGLRHLPRKGHAFTRVVSLILLLGVLFGALWHFSRRESPANPPVSGQRGNQVGQLCHEYSLPVITEDGDTGTTLDPSQTGTVTVVNFWGTWCTPCIEELPFFDRIARQYAGRVTVIAVHSALSRETAPDYIAEYYPDSPMVFACDGGEGFTGEYYTALGGRGTYPYTLVLDEEGVIAEIFLSSLSYEDLNAAVERLMEP